MKAVAPIGSELMYVTIPADVDAGQPRSASARGDHARPAGRLAIAGHVRSRSSATCRVEYRPCCEYADAHDTWRSDVLIVGAGPAGLAAAIAATKRGLVPVVEKGALVNSLLHYPTEMVFFTTPELMEIGGLPFTSPNDKPTRHGSAALLPARRPNVQA